MRPPDPAREKMKKEADEARARWKNAVELPVILPRLLGEDSGEHELTIERGRVKVGEVLGVPQAWQGIDQQAIQ